MRTEEIHRRLATLVLAVHRRNGGRLETLDPAARLLEPALGLDSLDLAEVMVAVEKEFGVSPFERSVPRTWGDIAAVVTKEAAGDREEQQG